MDEPIKPGALLFCGPPSRRHEVSGSIGQRSAMKFGQRGSTRALRILFGQIKPLLQELGAFSKFYSIQSR